METTEQRGLGSIWLRWEEVRKVPKRPKPHFGAQPHNPEVAGSSPVPATKNPLISLEIRGFSFIFATFPSG